MADDKFDVIVVGAGIAGSVAALLLARQGLEVVLIERGPYPGSKNLSGGVLYGRVLEQIFPNFYDEAPVERVINNQVISFMTGESAFNVDFKTQSMANPPYNGVTVLRARFDRWLAEQAESAGAMLVPGIKVEKVLKYGGRVVGVAAGDEEMLADVVVAADGVTSFITQDAGLRRRIEPRNAALGVKQLIELPPEVIEDRFRLTGNEGTAYTIVGHATQGIKGGGFVYTNQGSLSVGLVMKIDDLVKHKMRSGDVMEAFMHHPMIAPLVKGGKLLEYGAHAVPEGGLANMPPLFTDGMVVVGDAAGLGINNGFMIRGMDLAVGSSIAAAEAIVEAKKRGDFSAASLEAYKEMLDQSYVMADMRTYARTPHFFENERLYRAYPDMLARMMTRIYTSQAQPKQHLVPELRQTTRESGVSMLDLAKDLLDGARSL